LRLCGARSPKIGVRANSFSHPSYGLPARATRGHGYPPPVFPFDQNLLAIYLQDHLAGATVGVELARRAASENAATALGEILESLKDEIEDDRASLNTIMSVLEISPDRLKNAAGWAGEKAGRLKLNGRLTSYSPLSPVVELEALIAGVNGKRALWRALRRLADDDPRLQADQLEELLARADRQLETLWSVHSEASHAALGAAD
jgi:hypothetical protein